MRQSGVRRMPPRRLRNGLLRGARAGARSRAAASRAGTRVYSSAHWRASPLPGAAPGYVYADVSPGLALFLGMIPGVGAIYNGQYAKGLVHAVVFGILCSIADAHTGHGTDFVFGMMAFAWWAYMVFEAYHTARKRRYGEPVDEYSSILNLRGGKDQVPFAGVALIVLGILMLLQTLNLLDFDYVARYWPVLLIAAGAYLLYGRFAAHSAAPEEARHERQ